MVKMELKDLLYYSDLMYELQNIAGFDMDVDFDTLNRIKTVMVIEFKIGSKMANLTLRKTSILQP